jgi:hypothetical protein
MNASEPWFRLLLRLYPADFRDEMGEALVETYLHRSHETSVAWVWVVALWDSLRNGVSERVRPAVAWRRTGNWGRDMEIVSRRLRQRPMFLGAVLATLTAGLGTFAVVYTAVDKILLEPLPYKNPGDLYVVWEKVKDEGSSVITGPDVANLQKAGGAIEAAAGLQMTPVNLPGDGEREARRIIAMEVSPSLFDLLGVRPALGRGFRPDETGPNSPDVIVLTDELWKRLGDNSNIIGTELKIGRTPFTVIGVMPPGFRFNGSWAAPPDAYVPLFFNLAAWRARGEI